MFFMLKLILIISINFREMHADSMQDSEVILLPAWNSTEAEKLSLTLKVFGKLMQLNLRRNDQLLWSVFEMWKNERNVTEMLSKLKTSDFCLYLHDDYVSTAAIDICQEDGLKGFVVMDKDLLEIEPLQAMSFIHDFCTKEQINQSFGKPHLIKRSLKHWASSDFYRLHKIRPKQRSNLTVYIIQLVVTFDPRVYNGIMNFLDFNKNKMHEFAWLYVNEIQKVFDYLTDRYRVILSVTHFHFIKRTPYWGTNNIYSRPTLYSFCQHINKFKPSDFDNPYHWDIGLFVFGINDGYLGNSYIGTVCNKSTSCATVGFSLAQVDFHTYKDNKFFGLENEIRQSAIIAAREITHVIGVAYKWSCNDSIMCRGYLTHNKYIKWSLDDVTHIQFYANRTHCLRDHPKPKNLDCSKWSTDTSNSVESYELPGRTYNAKEQCMFLLGDENANVVTLHDICKNLQCETPYNNKSHFFGRALNGTYCAHEKECCDGECVPVVEPPYIFNYCEYDNWSEWEEDSCKSGCLEKSKAVKIRRRTCKHEGQRTANCSGPYYDVIVCDDNLKLCNSYKTIAAYTYEKCSEFKKVLNITAAVSPGFQYSHNDEEPWIACTIYCLITRFNEIPQKLMDYDVDPYFPDGTWCHERNNQNYYCRQHYCLPENHSLIRKCNYC